MQQSGVDEPLRNQRGSARCIEVGSRKSTARLEIGQEGDLAVDLVEIVDGQAHAGFAGDGQEVENGIRRASGRRDGRDGIFDRPSVMICRGRRSLFRRSMTSLPAFKGDVVLAAESMAGTPFRPIGGNAEKFECNRHRIGGELPAARAGARAGMVFQILELRIRHRDRTHVCPPLRIHLEWSRHALETDPA